MSSVACLAGEGRTDAPMTASPVIRAFVVIINDRMPPEVRRRLKPFARRVIGTNDGLDEARTKLLRRALAEEVLPLVLGGRHAGHAPVRCRRSVLGHAWIRLVKSALRHRIADLLDQAAYDQRPELGIDLAHAAGEILSLYALEAGNSDEEGRFWGKAIEVLDRLCNVGAETRAPGVRPDRLEWLERSVATHERVVGRGGAGWAPPPPPPPPGLPTWLSGAA